MAKTHKKGYLYRCHQGKGFPNFLSLIRIWHSRFEETTRTTPPELLEKYGKTVVDLKPKLFTGTIEVD